MLTAKFHKLIMEKAVLGIFLTLTHSYQLRTKCDRLVTKSSQHYANMSVQYTAIFHGCKNGNFHMRKCEIFLFFAQNIDRRYTLEPPH